MSKTFNTSMSAAWGKLGIGSREKPGEIFPKYTKRDFDSLKADYNAQFGYTIRIPQWDDVVHLVPNALKDEKTIKAEKREALVRVLESPAPDWATKFSSVMTWIDDIQDTSSLLYPLLGMLGRAAPKAFGKLTSVIGWIATGYDLLNVANAIGRAPLTGMKSKREVCGFIKRNPFSKVARLERVNKVRNYKPGIADVMQALQVTDQYTGFGLSLGGVMGLITNLPFAAYRYATGKPVEFSFDPPEVGNLEMMGARGLRAAAAIGAQGQVFSEMQHFWTYMTAYCSSMALAGTFRDEGLTDLIEKPSEVMLPAPEPTDPLTIAVIKEQGLRVEDGIGWPFNGEKFIPVGDYIDATAEPCRANFVEYSKRHEFDSYGFLSAAALDSLMPQVFLSLDPEAEWKVDDSDDMKVFWRMIKAPLLPTGSFSREKGDSFFEWVRGYSSKYGKTPGILEIESKFDQLGIKFQTSYPDKPGPDFNKYWPDGWTGEDSF